MKVSLNLKPCEVPEDLETFQDVVQFVERERIPSGEVITRIVCDGDELDEEREKHFRDTETGQISMLEFYSRNTIDLAQEGLTDANELLPSLAEDLPLVAVELRTGNVAEALAMFSKCVEIISWYVSLITAVDVIFSRTDPGFRLDPTTARTAEDLAPEADLTGLTAEVGSELRTFASIENLRQKLIDIEQAQSNNDALLLADLIEYELMPIIKIWMGEVPILLNKVNREGGRA
jgi:hypothetical protein